MFVVALGDPFEGIKLFGPFDTAEDAENWAETEVKDESWSLVEVQEP